MRDATQDRPAGRLLALLELLQSHPQLSGQQLAAQLGVERRTIRRYIQQLEALGIPVTTTRGPAGGYGLVPGYKLPPMMFTNDEVVALALGLAAVRNLESGKVPQAAASAQAKLERVMPAPVKRRLRSIVASVALPAAHAASDAFLPLLSAAAHEGTGVHLAYRDLAGKLTARDFDPYGLALYHGHWYVTGYCHLRKDLRTFRLDRVSTVADQSRHFEKPANFDVAAHLKQAIATLPRAYAIEVRIAASTPQVRQHLAPEIGLLESTGTDVLLRSQADDLDWFARELARLPWPFEILTPKALRTAIKRHARKLAAC